MQQECPHCNFLTSDQQEQLATPSQKLKKAKLDNKSDKKEEGSTGSTLTDLTLLSVLGAMNKEKQLKASAKGAVKEKKAKKQSSLAKSFKIESELKLWTRSGQNVFQGCKAMLVARKTRQTSAWADFSD